MREIAGPCSDPVHGSHHRDQGHTRCLQRFRPAPERLQLRPNGLHARSGAPELAGDGCREGILVYSMYITRVYIYYIYTKHEKATFREKKKSTNFATFSACAAFSTFRLFSFFVLDVSKAPPPCIGAIALHSCKDLDALLG